MVCLHEVRFVIDGFEILLLDQTVFLGEIDSLVNLKSVFVRNENGEYCNFETNSSFYEKMFWENIA